MGDEVRHKWYVLEVSHQDRAWEKRNSAKRKKLSADAEVPQSEGIQHFSLTTALCQTRCASDELGRQTRTILCILE